MVAAQPFDGDKIDLLLSEVRTLRAEVHALREHERAQGEFIDAMTPILKEMIRVGGEKLEVLEERGYFAFGRGALGVLDQIVTGFSPEDIRELGDNIVRILGAVKNATQPAMVAIADEATSLLASASEGKPLTWRGFFRVSRDADVQRGLAAVTAVLRRIGQVALETTEARRSSKSKLELLLAPRSGTNGHAAKKSNSYSRARPAKPPPAPRPQAWPTQPAPHATHEAPAPEAPKVKAPPFLIPGIELDADGFLADPSTWTTDIALQIAHALGYHELTQNHWKVIEFARAEFESTKRSPNVRRLSSVMGGSVKTLYALFPNTPGKSAARIAGIPKPAGCI
jgi:dissimilatory sulfite reductase related protein